MGGTSSKSTINKLTDIAYNATNRNIQSCVGAATQSQLIKINNVAGDVDLSGLKQKQGISINMQCAFSNAMQDKIQNDIASDISAELSAKGGDYTSMGKSSSKSNMDIKNIIKTNIDNENVSKQVSTTLQQQTVSVSDVGGSVIARDISQEQGAKIISEAIVNTTQYRGVLNKIAEEVDASVKSENEGIFNAAFGMMGSMGMWFAIAAVALAILGAVGYGGYMMYQSNLESGGSAVSGAVKFSRPSMKIPAPPML